ncbi:TIGR04104 family putative zinc finger protein [Paenibacillus sp.]|uniref:TIGR04104 family putative zinc finger protein n=1 Tax=Paenibacillus sp. TaxID=58172 RepID=UPI0039C8DED6
MQRCKECYEPFLYKELFLSGLTGYKPISCVKCNKKHTVTLSSRISSSLLIVAFPMSLSMYLLKDLIQINPVVIYLCIVIPTLFILPFVLRYKLEQNHKRG